MNQNQPETSILTEANGRGGGATSAEQDGVAAYFLEKYPLDQPVTGLDATDMRHLLHAAYDWLAHNHEQVNRMNVFPVPDGDTGTNMMLTVKSAWAMVHSRPQETAGGVLKAAAEGAHHGSRGNSGVILGQILSGLSQALQQKAKVSALDLVEGLRHAADVAYASVPAPVEGTILTVVRDVAKAAAASVERAAEDGQRDLRNLLATLVEAADRAVQRTPELLPVLKRAGVVDSGGKGLYFVFEGMYRALMGQTVALDENQELAGVISAEIDHQLQKGNRTLPPLKWGFDVQFLVEQPTQSVSRIMQEIAAMGDCPLVEGDENLVKVHVHVFDPGVVLSYGVQLGFMTDVVVENMDDMAAAARIGSEGASDDAPHLSFAAHLPDEEGVGLVAVAPGAGFSEIFHNLGVHVVVPGGQTMNPSTAELADAMRTLESRRIFLLPNNKNIRPAAEQAAQLLMEEEPGRQVRVVPTVTVPQGIAALMGLDPSLTDVDDLAAALALAAGVVSTGEVTQAVRSTDVDGLHVEAGDIIGLHDGKLVVAGSSVQEMVLDLLVAMDAAQAEIITVYYGDFVSPESAENLIEQLQDVYPDLDVELAYGGQPHYFYILSTE